MTVSPEVWTRVAAERVFFGHQSVGDNILDGVRELQRTAGVGGVKILDITRSGTPAGPALLHAHIGRNGDPLSKVRAFRETLNAGLGEDLDVAALKFCFWDVRSGTDVERVFVEYDRTIADLQRQYPRVRFVHMTVPLFTRDGDWRAGVRRLLGRPVPRTLDNARRHELSERLRARYGGRERLFDLESLQASAAREQGVPHLDSALTDDGGHLNQVGRTKLAAAFLETLAGARE